MCECLLFLNKTSKYDNHLEQISFISNLIVFELYFKNETKSTLNDILLKEISQIHKMNNKITIESIESFLSFFNSSQIKNQLTPIISTSFFNKTTNYMFKDHEFTKELDLNENHFGVDLIK